jgi:hypothetical protein
MCLVVVSFLSLYTVLPAGVAQATVPTVTVVSLQTVLGPVSYVSVTVNNPQTMVGTISFVTVTLASPQTFMGEVSRFTVTVFSYLTVTGLSYVTVTVLQPHEKKEAVGMPTSYRSAPLSTRGGLIDSPTPIPEYDHTWLILLMSIMAILLVCQPKFPRL